MTDHAERLVGADHLQFKWQARAEAAEHERDTLRTLGEWAVTIISNVSEGDLTKQTDEWQTSAIQWLNEFHARRSS